MGRAIEPALRLHERAQAAHGVPHLAAQDGRARGAEPRPAGPPRLGAHVATLRYRGVRRKKIPQS